MPKYRFVNGFTMIELVVVIVLMSIISLTGVEIISFTLKSYEKMIGRQSLGNSARIAVDRISRELRGALPGSARVSGACLEFIPINAAGTYLDLPVVATGTSFQAIPLNPGQAGASGRVAVYPIGNNAYDLSSNVLSAVATVGVPDGNNEIKVTLSATHQFPNDSPRSRFFLVAAPVSFCVDGNNLFRYQNYGFSSGQKVVATLPGVLPDRALLVNNMGVSATPFVVIGASLSRNAIVAVSLNFTEAGESVQLVHEVQLRNVP